MVALYCCTFSLSVCIRKIIQLIIMKKKMEIKNRSHRYKCSKYKKCLAKMITFT